MRVTRFVTPILPSRVYRGSSLFPSQSAPRLLFLSLLSLLTLYPPQSIKTLSLSLLPYISPHLYIPLPLISTSNSNPKPKIQIFKTEQHQLITLDLFMNPCTSPLLSFFDESDYTFFNAFEEPKAPFLPIMPVSDSNKRKRVGEPEEQSPKRRSPSSNNSQDSNELTADNGPTSVASGVSPSRHHQRRLWVKDRSNDWWDRYNSPDLPEAEFKHAFRMSRATFEFLCEQLGSAVAKEDTMLRAAIPVRQRVAVCIWRLATGEPLRVVSKRFGLGISTCHKLVLEVCTAIKTLLMPKTVQWPDQTTSQAVAQNFEYISGIPNIIGSMHTTHIPIIAPKVEVAAYYNKRHTERNQKTSYSITIQGVVNPNGVFTDVCIGWPGSMPDDQVLEKSALYQRGNAGLIQNNWIVGGAGFPLMDWLLVPYTHQNLTWTQHAFNEKVGEVASVARDAFARLKGRWTCLQKRTEGKLVDLPVVLGACVVLHNICEMRGDTMDPELHFELSDDDIVAENAIRSVTAVRARDSIAHNLLHSGHAGMRFFN